ncbi:hypothetical protein ACHAWF_006169 [Thalassiosira exigua]
MFAAAAISPATSLAPRCAFAPPPPVVSLASLSLAPPRSPFRRLRRRPSSVPSPRAARLVSLSSSYPDGLTDDGDFAVFGINASEDDDEEEEETGGGGLLGGGMLGGGSLGGGMLGGGGLGGGAAGLNAPQSNTGTPIGSQGVGGMLFDEELQRSGRVDLGVGPSNRYRDFRGNEVVPKVDPEVRSWLLETLPSLGSEGNGELLESYARRLTELGFHPSCASLCEVTYDDLDFMKVLHRRYLYKEMTGDDHPFEP